MNFDIDDENGHFNAKNVLKLLKQFSILINDIKV